MNLMPIYKSIIISVFILITFSCVSYSLFQANINEREAISHSRTDVICKCNNECSLAIEALKNNHSIYLNNVWSTMGFLFVAVGWVITSDKARGYLRSSSFIRNVSLSVITILMVFHTIILFDAVFESERIHEQIKSIVGADYYKINFVLAVCSAIVDGVFFFLLWVLVAMQSDILEDGVD